ncbi:hypothetical protein QYM36_014262, partial [Artemia franciscana]
EHTPMDRLHSKEVSKTSIVFRVITSKPTQWPKSSLDGLVFTTMIVGKLVIVRRSRKSEAVSQSQATDKIFTIVLTVCIMVNTVNMGCGLDLNIIKEVLKKPVGPTVGFLSQFCFMPMFGFAISWVVFNQNLLRLGLFVIGVCPGGVASNFWTLLFNGDVNLSITMTFVSTIAAMGMMPLWIWLLSGYYLNDYGNVKVPFDNLIMSLVTLTLPLGVGLLIRKYKRNWADFITDHVVKPTSLILMIAMTALAFYTLSHIFVLFDRSIVISGMILGWAGYAFGATFAWICRLKKPQIIAISFETALQNGSVGYIILKLSLPAPYSDLAALPAISAMLFTSFTLIGVYCIYMCYQKLSAYQKGKKEGKVKRNRSDLPTQLSQAPLLETPITPITPTFFGNGVNIQESWSKSSQYTEMAPEVYYPPGVPYTGRRGLTRQISDAETQTYYELN